MGIPTGTPTGIPKPSSSTIVDINEISCMGVTLKLNKSIHLAVSCQPTPLGVMYSIVCQDLPSLASGRTQEEAMEAFNAAIICYWFATQGIKYDSLTEGLQVIANRMTALVEEVNIDETKMR